MTLNETLLEAVWQLQGPWKGQLPLSVLAPRWSKKMVWGTDFYFKTSEMKNRFLTGS